MIRVQPCDPFQLGWEGYSLKGVVDNFALTPDQAAARQDLRLAGFTPVTPGHVRYVPGETLYWSVLLVNEGSDPAPLTLEGRVEGARVQVWYQHPWYTRGRGVSVEQTAYIVPELLLKHDRITSAADLMAPVHSDPDGPVRLTIPPRGFAKILLKVMTRKDAREGIKGSLRAGGDRLFTFQASAVPGDLDASTSWKGLYYGLLPGSNSTKYAVTDALFRADLDYLRELAIDSLVIPQPTLSEPQLAMLAEHGIKRLVLKNDEAESVREALAASKRLGIETAFYTADEPHYSHEAQRDHLRRARRIHEGGGKTYTAVSDAFDRKPFMQDTLDMPNLAVWSLSPPARPGDPALRGTYYWQCAFERPVVNRFLAGLFGPYVGGKGFMAFVYRDAFRQDHWEEAFTTDAAPIYQNRLRHHFLAYPGQAGPIRTIQAEALHQGICDERVLAAARARAPEGAAILLRQLAPTLKQAMTSRAMEQLYNGKPPTSLTVGSVDMAFLVRAREKALDLLAHANERKTVFHRKVDPLDVRVRLTTGGGLRLSPPDLWVSDFPLCLIEGFGAEATPEAIAQALFGRPHTELDGWTLQGDEG